MTVEIPEDLSTVEDLDTLASNIKAEAERLAEDADPSEETLAEIERLLTSFTAVKAEKKARADAEAERTERLKGALDSFNDDEPAAEPEAPAEPETPAEPAEAAAAPEAVETAAVAPTPPAEAPAEAPSSTQEAAVTDPTPAPSVTVLKGAAAEAPTPRVESPAAPAAGLVASGGFPDKAEGESIDRMELAKAIVSKRHTMSMGSGLNGERISVGRAASEGDFFLTGSQEANFAVIDRIRKDHAAKVNSETALVAAGGVCAPLEPNYDFFRLAQEMNPVEQALPTANASRGGIRFISPPDFRDASGGVRITTEEQDAAGYVGQDLPDPATNNTPVKPCVRVVCPPVEECRVDAISQCVTFGNLNYRVFPEQVNAFLDDLAVIFTETKEIFYLDAIDAASTEVTFAPSYSATRGITYTLLAAAANYRRRHHMAPDATLELFLPSWVVEFLKVDLINDHSMGLGFLGAGQAQVAQVFATMDLDITWYYDSATGAGQAFNQAQAEGELNPFPSSVVAYLYAPGTFVRLDGGTLDVGLVRDSILNGTNDLQLFSEEWLQVCMVGLESLRIEISLCPDGTAPEPVVPLDCLASV